MSNNQSNESVHVTREERLHPALRKLGRACIALARWQRRQDAQHSAREATADDAVSPPTASSPPPTDAAPAASRQEQGHE